MLKKDLKKFYKNLMRGLFRNCNNKNLKIIYGSFGLKSLENGLISVKYIEFVRRILFRRLKKIVKIWIRIKLLNYVILKIGDRCMGKGKGVFLIKIFKICCGMILFEVEGIVLKIIIDLLKKVKKKLLIKMKVSIIL